MKFSLALFASAVVATHLPPPITTTPFVTVDRTSFNSERSCIRIQHLIVDSRNYGVGPAIQHSFQGFGIKTTDKFYTYVQFKTLAEEVRGTTRVQNYDIYVKFYNVAWQDAPHVTMARSRALLQIVGTLNLYHKIPTRPWKARITIDADGTSHPFIPSSTYSRPSTVISQAQGFALKTGCRTPFPK